MKVSEKKRNIAITLGALGLFWLLCTKEPKLPRQDNRADEASIPPELIVPTADGGFYFGKVPLPTDRRSRYRNPAAFCGKPMDMDGNILVVGGPGSGKTTGHVYPTMETWKGSMVMLDVKGDMEALWRSIHKEDGKKLYVFAPLHKGAGTCAFDPFALMKANPTNAAGHACDIAEALVPLSASDREPVWSEAAQSVLTGALVYYFYKEKPFMGAMAAMGNLKVSEIIRIIMDSGCERAKPFVSKFQGASDKTMASIGLNLTKLSRFLLNQEVIGSLTPSEGRPLLDWSKLNEAQEPFDVIIDVHGVALNQCAPLVRLMLTQLVQVLSMREEKSYRKGEVSPLLICIDEFPQLERMPTMLSALTTLRSKSVTMALCVQSLASLDATYGHDEARVILDACSFKVIRNANDLESQKYLSELIGTMDILDPSLSTSLSMQGVSASVSAGRKQRPVIYPEALGRLKDPILITPYGTCQVPPLAVYPPKKEKLTMTVEILSAEVESLQAMLEVSLDKIGQVSNQLDVGDICQAQASFSAEDEAGACAEAQNANSQDQRMDEICRYCAEMPRTAKQIVAYIGAESRSNCYETYIRPLIEKGRLEMTNPESPTSPNQKYRAASTDQS